jgi:hypothetical protein
MGLRFPELILDTLAERVFQLEAWKHEAEQALAELVTIRQEAVDLREALAGEPESEAPGQRLIPAATACIRRLRSERDATRASACT